MGTILEWALAISLVLIVSTACLCAIAYITNKYGEH